MKLLSGAAEAPVLTPYRTMNTNDKNLGIGLIVVGGAGLFWVYIRATNLAGQLHSWSPPFDSYEVTTIIGGLLAVLCLTVGVRKAKRKPDAGEKG